MGGRRERKGRDMFFIMLSMLSFGMPAKHGRAGEEKMDGGTVWLSV